MSLFALFSTEHKYYCLQLGIRDRMPILPPCGFGLDYKNFAQGRDTRQGTEDRCITAQWSQFRSEDRNCPNVQRL
jgi:hypothetical protein